MLELDPRVSGGEAPVYGAPHRVAPLLPGGCLAAKRRPVGDAPIQALPREHGEFDLGHVQPRAVLGCVVDLQLLRQSPGLLRVERLVERRRVVGVEVRVTAPKKEFCTVREWPAVAKSGLCKSS